MKTQLHSFKILITTTILLFSVSLVEAAPISSTAAGGNWSATGTWVGGVVPGSGDDVTIVNTANVTVDISNAACATLNINSGSGSGTATLTFNNSSVLTVSGTITIGAGGSRAGSIIMTNGGTWKIGGTVTINNLNTFTGGTGTLEYTSTNPAINAGFIYQNLAFSGSGTAGASGALTIQGNLTNTGGGTLNFGANNVILSGTTAANSIAGFTTTGTVSMTKTAGTVSFAGNVNGGGLTINGTGGTLNLNVVSPLTHTFTGTWTRTAGTLIGGSSTLKLASNFSGTGGTFTAGVGTIEWNGAGAQTLAALSYFNLTLSNNGAKTVTGTTVNGTISLQGTATAAGTSPTYGASSTLEFAGSASQTSTNVELPASAGPANLKINNSSGVTLHAARTFNGIATTFANGILNTTAANLLTFNNGATTLGSSNASFVNGPVRKIFNAAEAFTFPIGVTGTGDEPLGIAGSTALNDDFTAQYLRSSAKALGGVNSPILNVSACDQWVLTKNSGPGANVSVTLSWDANSPCGSASNFITDPASLTVAHFNGSTWDQAGTSGGSTGNATAGTVTRDGVTVFSPFALGNTAAGQNPLPVKFGDIKGYAKNSGIQIDWSVYTENNLSRYEVERSENGNHFISVGQTAAHNSIGKSDYSWLDAVPLHGTNFYRIKSVDLDGKYGYSIIIRVNLNQSGKGISVYPNPVQNGYVSFQSADLQKGDYTLKILNNAGQEVYKQKFVHEGGAISQTISLPAGIRSGLYNLQLINGKEVTNKTFIVQ
jgi:hypothetical protein